MAPSAGEHRDGLPALGLERRAAPVHLPAAHSHPAASATPGQLPAETPPAHPDHPLVAGRALVPPAPAEGDAPAPRSRLGKRRPAIDALDSIHKRPALQARHNVDAVASDSRLTPGAAALLRTSVSSTQIERTNDRLDLFTTYMQELHPDIADWDQVAFAHLANFADHQQNNAVTPGQSRSNVQAVLQHMNSISIPMESAHSKRLIDALDRAHNERRDTAALQSGRPRSGAASNLSHMFDVAVLVRELLPGNAPPSRDQAFLLLLCTTGLRCIDLHSIIPSSIQVAAGWGNHGAVQFTYVPKATRAKACHRTNHVDFLSSRKSRHLCPATTLLALRDDHARLGGPDNCLWLQTVKTSQPVLLTTMNSAVTRLLQKSIDTATPHRLRWLWRAKLLFHGVPEQTVERRGGWSLSSVSQKHYPAQQSRFNLSDIILTPFPQLDAQESARWDSCRLKAEADARKASSSEGL